MNFFKKKTKGEAAFDIGNTIFMLFISFITVYPIWYVLIISFNDATDAKYGGIYFWPRVFSIHNYEAVFQNNSILSAFAVTILKTLIGTLVSIFFTAMTAYAFSKTQLPGRKLFMTMGVIILFFDGGLIPYFLLIKNLGLYDNFLVYIIPAMFNFYNLLIFQAFFRGIPEALEESARLDGANDIRIFVSVIIPLSAPVLATLALFNGVAQWNDFFTGVIYINKDYLQPVQTLLYKIITQSSTSSLMMRMSSDVARTRVSSESIKMATMIITIAPIVCVYPFLQKYFVKGIMLGSVKG